MTKSKVTILILFILFTSVLIVFALAKLLVGDASFIYSLLLLILGAIGAIIFKPLQNFLEGLFSEQQKICRISICGRAGSGKTSLIKKVTTLDSIGEEESTQKFKVYPGEKRLKLDEVPVKFLIADYEGQVLSTTASDGDPKFIGKKGRRLINAIFFIVSIVPREDDQGNIIDKDADLLKWLKDDTETKIKKGVAQQLNYLGQAGLQMFLQALCNNPNKNLKSVRLLINKIDLLEELIVNGCLPNLQIADSEKYAKDYFASYERDLKEACKKNNIEDANFQTYVISTKTGKNIDDMLKGVLEVYQKSNK